MLLGVVLGVAQLLIGGNNPELRDPEIYGALIRGFGLRESTACKVLLKPPSETHGAWVNSGRNLPGKPPK